MTETMIEALYQREVQAAHEAYHNALVRAEARKQKALEALRERERADYRTEQQFFYQG